MNVRPAALSDAAEISDIYNYYVRTSHATFELKEIDVSEMIDRIRHAVIRHEFLVAEIEGAIAGYAYGRAFRPREAYQHSVEVSVYVCDRSIGSNVGTELYSVLIPELIEKGFHTLIAGISLPNEASIRLHEKFGFEKVAHFKEVGRKFDRWVDVGYWQLLTSVSLT